MTAGWRTGWLGLLALAGLVSGCPSSSSGDSSSSASSSSSSSSAGGASSGAGSAGSSAGGSSSASASSAAASASSAAASASSSGAASASSTSSASSSVTGASSSSAAAVSSSSSSSSGGSSGGARDAGYADFTDVGAWCRAYTGDVVCASPSCAAFDENACRTAWNTACAEYERMFRGWADAGLVENNPAGTGECLAFFRDYLRASNANQCGTLSTPAFLRQLFGFAYYDAPTCTNGAPRSPYKAYAPFYDCNLSPVRGTQPNGAACSDDTVCASTECNDPADGGCGSCVDGGVREAFVLVGDGGACAVPGDGGLVANETCDEGFTCDTRFTGRCIPYRPLGGSCRPGVAACAANCGLRCNSVDGGAGTCVALPSVNQPCGFNDTYTELVTCERGLTCAMQNDAGTVDFRNGRCRPHANAGGTCSTAATNYDPFALFVDTLSGGLSFDPSPACVTGFRCVAATDGGATGTCVSQSSAPDNAVCDPNLEAACSTAGRVCRQLDGEYRCLPPLTVGARCKAGDECIGDAWCNANPDGGGVCAAPVADGQPCREDEQHCSHLSLCAENRCAPALSFVANEPICQ